MINVKDGRKGFERISNYPAAKDVTREDVRVAGVPCSWFIPGESIDDHIVVYIHGGGFIFGSVNSHAPMVSHIAKLLNRKVLFIDYKLAPEHPFPASIDDCYTVINALYHENANIKFGIIGDSAGGNIAMATQLVLKSAQEPKAEYSIVISPWVNLECNTPSYERNKETEQILSRPYLMEAARLYATGHELMLPLISPAHGNFEGLAPVLILCSANEILEDDSVQLKNQLQKNGVDVKLRLFPDQAHVWPFLDINTPASQSALSEIANFVATHYLPFGK